MDTDVLERIGLNPSQTKVYLSLLRSGKQTPPQIAAATGEPRTNAYNLLAQLEEFGLAEKVPGEKACYQAKSPSALRQLLVERTQEINKMSTELSALLPSLQSAYRLAYDRPGVVHADGVEALKMIYDDLIQSGTEPLIFPSQFDRDNPETSEVIDEQIARQRKAGLGSKVLLAKDDPLATEAESLKKQGIVASAALKSELPAQIIIYEDNVAFTTFRNGISSTVITNPEIAETMRRLFNEFWPDSERLVPTDVAGRVGQQTAS